MKYSIRNKRKTVRKTQQINSNNTEFDIQKEQTE